MGKRDVTIWHGTTLAAAAKIQSDGFKDATGNYLTMNEYTGVWVSDSPLSINEMYLEPDVYFRMTVPQDVIADYEWIQEHKGFREWLVPATILNELPRERLSAEEVDELD